MKSNRISLNYRKSLTTFLSLENQKINIKDKLFYYFLRHEDSISEFEKKKRELTLMEPLIIQKKKTNFYSIFLQMKKDYTFKGITLSYIYFPILYYKSRQMRKKIIQFAIENKKPIKEVFESYDPKNFSNLNVHNWFFTPRISYNKFLFKKMKEKNQKEKEEKNNLSHLYDTLSKSNIYVLTKTSSRERNLIYSGKLCNVFCQDPVLINKSKPYSFYLKDNKDFFYKYKNNTLVSQNINDLKRKKHKKKNLSNLNSSNFNSNSYKVNDNSPFLTSRPKIIKNEHLENNCLTSGKNKENILINNKNLKKYLLSKRDFIYY